VGRPASDGPASHLQLPEEAALWQLHGLYKALQSEGQQPQGST